MGRGGGQRGRGGGRGRGRGRGGWVHDNNHNNNPNMDLDKVIPPSFNNTNQQPNNKHPPANNTNQPPNNKHPSTNNTYQNPNNKYPSTNNNHQNTQNTQNPQNPNPGNWNQHPGQHPGQHGDQRGTKRKMTDVPGTYNDGVDDRWNLPRIVHPKFSVLDMRKTMTQAKALLAAYRRFESLRSNPISPDDGRSVWHFLTTRKGLDTGKMCYFVHQAGFDLDSEGDSIMKSGDVSCTCYDKSKGEIPECFLLVLFYFIAAAKVENGLYNFDQKG